MKMPSAVASVSQAQESNVSGQQAKRDSSKAGNVLLDEDVQVSLSREIEQYPLRPFSMPQSLYLKL